MGEELRVWWNTNSHQRYFPVNNINEALLVIKTLAIREQDDDTVVWNASGLEVKEDGEWVEYYSRKGFDIKEIREEMDNAK